MNKTLISIIFLLLSSYIIFAQGGSNYSIFGIGDIIYGQSAASQAMGGSQIAVPSQNTINMLNPALWSMVKTTRVQIGYRFNQNYIESTESDLLQNNGTINGFYSIFNFDPNREISAALLFQPVSTVNYYIFSPISNIESNLDIAGNKIYKGSGGVSNLTLGLGSKVVSGLYIGASISALIGKINHSIRTNITTTNAENYQINNTDIFSGLNGTFGVLLVPMENLCVGAFYQLSNQTDIENTREYVYVPSSSFLRDTALISNMSMHIPNFYGIGTSYKFGKYLIATDLLLGNFSDLQLYKANTADKFANSSKISLGLTILGSSNQYSSLIDRTSYKLGAYRENMYYRVNLEQIKEYAVSVGLQFPVSRTAQVDFSLIFGTRGTTNNNLISENFGRMIIEISIGDTWFKPIKTEY